MATRGTLFLVVGPSGSGKDTMIDGARAALAGDPRFVFPRRVITRPQTADSEVHETMTPDAFKAAEAAGAFALSWEAHGLRYGIPREIESDLSAGRHVVVNVSRAVVESASERYRPVRIVEVWAPVEVLAKRLASRGRESTADFAERLRRAEAVDVTGSDVTRIATTGSVAESVRKFLSALGAADES
jgi:ribose 1,5-bisphosphokinase